MLSFNFLRDVRHLSNQVSQTRARDAARARERTPVGRRAWEVFSEPDDDAGPTTN